MSIEFETFIAMDWKIIFKRIEYLFANTSLHGFPYIVNRSLNFIERILWICVIIVQLYFCYRYEKLILDRRSSHPILLAYDTRASFDIEVNNLI